MTLRKVYEEHEHFFVINDKVLLPAEMERRTYFITHSERDWKFFVNLKEAFAILRTERPDVILSTGAGPAVPFALIGKAFFRCRIVFIETIARVHAPSLTGRILYRLADDFFFQWEPLRQHFPKGIFGGTLV
jgi:UDP-N-acetylglucosamine:LPS N-acetylglucosamine transferase